MRSDKILYRKKRITIYLSRIVTKLLLHYNFFHNLLHKEKEKKKIELTDKFHFLIASFISTANTYVMRVVIQKVKNASVTVDEKVISSYVFENEVQFARNSPQTSILTLNSSIKELVKD